MKKLALSALALGLIGLQGCSPFGGTITAQQQRDKKAELQKVADEEKDPNRENRPQ